MTDPRYQYVPPSVELTAFNCPRCHAKAHHKWYGAFASYRDNNAVPSIVTEETIRRAEEDRDLKPASKTEIIRWCLQQTAGHVTSSPWGRSAQLQLDSVWFSRCTNCDDMAVWVHNNLVWPRLGTAPPANPDMPDDVRQAYDEASLVFSKSGRAAAAMLRLAVELLCRRLCDELSKTGNNINENIAILVRHGLAQRVQRALDIVRVTGNEAVHPGQIDWNDDQTTAARLFDLINIIVLDRISNERAIDELYDDLPPEKVKAIEKRDGNK